MISLLFIFASFLLEDSAPGNGDSNCSIYHDDYRGDVLSFCTFCGNAGPGGQCICFTEAELTSGYIASIFVFVVVDDVDDDVVDVTVVLFLLLLLLFLHHYLSALVCRPYCCV